MTAPLFSESGIPARVKVGLAALLSFNLAPLVAVPSLAHSNAYQILILGLSHTLLGVLTGTPIRTGVAAVQPAREHIGLQMRPAPAPLIDRPPGAPTAA